MLLKINERIEKIVTKFTCAFCSASAGYQVQFADSSAGCSEYGDHLGGIAFAIVCCKNCNMLHCFTFEVVHDEFGLQINEEWKMSHHVANNPDVLSARWDSDTGFAATTHLKTLGQYPYNRDFGKQMPKEIREELIEAGNCLAFGAYNAAAVMSGRALEHIVRIYLPEARGTLGVLMKNLVPLDEPQLHNEKKQAIPRPIYKALKEAIEWRNEGAHIHEKFYKTPQDIREFHELTVGIAEYVFAESQLDILTHQLNTVRRRYESG